MAGLTILSPSEQVAAFLRAEILRGRWVGTIPGGPALAVELGIDKKTVEAALRLLENEEMLRRQGAGRPRLIQMRGASAVPSLRVGLLCFDPASRGELFMTDLRYQLGEAGHVPFFARKSLLELGMSPPSVARLVRRTEADAWVVASASREVLEWFEAQATPAFALAGRHGGLSLAATRPDKSSSMGAAVHRLVALGHRRISLLCRRHLRLPEPAKGVRAYLAALDASGIATGAYHLPDWEETREGFQRILTSLFNATPPTALILDEAHLYHAACHFLARSGRRIPEEVSLLCTDGDYSFAWCEPSVAHIAWDHRPIVKRIVRWANNTARGRADRAQDSTKVAFVEGGSLGKAPACKQLH